MINSKNTILVLAAVAAVVLVAAAAISSGILKKPTSQQTATRSATNSAGTTETGGPVDGDYNFKGTITSVKAVSGGTEITVEWPVDATKIEKRAVIVTPSAKVTEGPEGTAPTPTTASNLKVGQEVVVEATLEAKTITWTVKSVHILKS